MNTTALAQELGLGTNLRPRPEQVQNLLAEVARLRAQLETQAEVIEDLTRQATHDQLTGLLNRHGFEMALSDAMAYFRRYNRQAALLMIDLNGFKTINDTMGHAAGDAVLAHVATVLRKCLRDSDVIARLGGDEYCIILREAGATEALLKKSELEGVLAVTPCVYNDQELFTSASIGVCTFGDAENTSELLHKADVAMYRQKAAGKHAR